MSEGERNCLNEITMFSIYMNRLSFRAKREIFWNKKKLAICSGVRSFSFTPIENAVRCEAKMKKVKMKFFAKPLVAFFLFLVATPNFAQGQYVGSGSVSQGLATTTVANLLTGCAGARVSAVGTIVSTDGKTWTVPAATEYAGKRFLPDLYNQCNGFTPASINVVNLAALPTVVIDNAGEIITGFLFGDNYFELYINGILVGVDPTPFTPFNSCVVRFKVARPYTIAVKLVDWEENLGVGSENNGGNPYHAGDGGFIAKFSDGTVTDSTWRAQTFYIAPIQNVSAVVELPDNTRSTATASTSPTCNSSCYAVHYSIPSDWQEKTFVDNVWPHAKLYTPAAVGANNPAYINFLSTWENAQFIWSSNLILDNVVLARKTVFGTTGVNHESSTPNSFALSQNYPNPFNPETIIQYQIPQAAKVQLKVYDIFGREVAALVDQYQSAGEYTVSFRPPILAMTSGVYFYSLQAGQFRQTRKTILMQ